MPGPRKLDAHTHCPPGAGSASSSIAAASYSTIKVYEAGRQASGKRVVAETVVQAPVDVVWRVLTNYERLADFVPNLESCERLPSPRAGKVGARFPWVEGGRGGRQHGGRRFG